MLSRARLKSLRALHRKKERSASGLLLVEGNNLVREAVAEGFARELFLTPERAESDEGRGWKREGIATTLLSDRDVEALAETRSPAGAFALVEDPRRPWDSFLPPDEAVVLLAAGVADPGNLGTLIRTAAALGAAAVVSTAGTVEATNPKAVRATAGALFKLPVLHGEAEEVAGSGFALLLADARGAPVTRLRERPRRSALVVGNEPRGLPDSMRAISAGSLAVPLAPGVESLNVSVAAGILLHVLRGLPAAGEPR